MEGVEPILLAVSSNANHLYTLLRCIGFTPKVSIQITPEGIRFSAEEGRAMQGLAFLDRALFTNYALNLPNQTGDLVEGPSSNSLEVVYPHFLVSLSALLETLQIFGTNDVSARNSFAATSTHQENQSIPNAFTSPALLLDRSCTLRYSHLGSPFCIVISEGGVTTTCELTTYEPDDPTFGLSGGELNIPLQREAIIMKIIMHSSWLHDAITELDPTNPTILTISASAKPEPLFALSGSGGPFSEYVVQFAIEKERESSSSSSHTTHKDLTQDGTSKSHSKRPKEAPTVTEIFLVNPPSSMGSSVKQSYRFSLIRKAARAMAVASKVSIRGDIQGVLSLQFMVELGNNNGMSGGYLGGMQPTDSGGNISFVDFRFVPLIDDERLEENQ